METIIDLGDLTPKQKLFCQSRARFTAYGGARGGGKTHVARIKALGGALRYPGLRVLFLRRHYPELEQTVVLPLRGLLPDGAASYNSALHLLSFPNGSFLKFGHLRPGDEAEYQGQEWDWIFLDEATQFTENQFRVLGACLRGVTDLPRRMYLTCNPGGVGHNWVKRLFLDRDFRPDEHPADYAFIPATVEDNPALLRHSPDYINMLDNLPDDLRRAWRWGDWDALSGAFFPEFRREQHIEPALVRVPRSWRLYRAFDYGLDMLACLWIGVDPAGRAHVYREVQRPGLIVSQAAELIRRLTPPGEEIFATFAPPDMWSRQKDSGRTMAELFAQNGVEVLRADNRRTQGWMEVKERLKPWEDGRPGLLIGSGCRDLIHHLGAIQHDEDRPDDCAVQPHDLTHICDALRYFCAARVLGPEKRRKETPFPVIHGVSYQESLCGGETLREYLEY